MNYIHHFRLPCILPFFHFSTPQNLCQKYIWNRKSLIWRYPIMNKFKEFNWLNYLNLWVRFHSLQRWMVIPVKGRIPGRVASSHFMRHTGPLLHILDNAFHLHRDYSGDVPFFLFIGAHQIVARLFKPCWTPNIWPFIYACLAVSDIFPRSKLRLFLYAKHLII